MKDVKHRIMTLIIILSKIYIATSEIVIKPRVTEAVIGNETFLNCSTSDPSKGIQWYYSSVENPGLRVNIYRVGDIRIAYKSRARLETYKDVNNTVALNLVINSVNKSDAGEYVCQEEHERGLHGSAELIVLESLPVCRVLDQGDGFMGPNTCGIEREEILLSCTTEYHGNISPIFQWRNDGIEISNYSYNQSEISNSVTSVLKYRPDMDSVKIPASFHCQTTRSASEQFGCIIAPRDIKIIYAFQNFSISHMSVGEKATCTANSSQTCLYKWILVDDGNDSVASNNSEVTFDSPGSYRCEAKCTFRKKFCPVISALVLVSNSKASNQEHLKDSPGTTMVPSLSCDISGNNWWQISAIVMGLLLFVSIVLGFVLVTRLRRQKKQLNRMNEPEGMLDPEIQVDLETRNLMPQVQHALDTETEIGRTTENTCSSTDLTCREGRNGLKTEDAKLGNVKRRKPSSELHDEEPR